MTRNATIHIRLTQDLREKVESKAVQDCTSISSVVTEALNRYLSSKSRN